MRRQMMIVLMAVAAVTGCDKDKPTASATATPTASASVVSHAPTGARRTKGTKPPPTAPTSDDPGDIRK